MTVPKNYQDGKLVGQNFSQDLTLSFFILRVEKRKKQTHLPIDQMTV